ncbi:hypothetical protein [Vibrio lentus]|uniref:hypothetical protein n=1 Tax=Vibrio lentus TaxID=136468 RepID=UPI0018E44293|nr:hypothetical protein [Vibrio lentus]
MRFKVVMMTVALFFLMSVATAHAFSVDKMVIVSDKKGNGVVTLKNDAEHSIFVQSQIQEVTVDSGQGITRTDYTRENLSDWKVSLTHPKLVLRPGEEKDVGIRSLCHNISCDNTKDLMFMLPFTPSKYREGEKKPTGVEINYGFSPLYIIPTSQPNYAYDISNDGETLRVNNKGNTMIHVFVDACNDQNQLKCKQKFSVIAGRDKTFELTNTMQRPRLKITVTSHDKSYSVTETVEQP